MTSINLLRCIGDLNARNVKVGVKLMASINPLSCIGDFNAHNINWGVD